MRKLLSVPLLMAASASQAVVFYDLTKPEPPLAFANLDPNVIMMDDVLIPVNRLNGQPRISITRIDTKIFIAQPGTYTIEAWISKAKISNSVLQPEFPLTRLISDRRTYTVANEVRNITLFPTRGNELVNLPVLPLSYQGNDYGVIFFGMSFSAPLDRLGWVLADRPDVNIDGFWGHYGQGDSRNGPKVLFDDWASFNLKITGNPVPEPASIAVLGAACLVLLRRRARAATKFRG